VLRSIPSLEQDVQGDSKEHHEGEGRRIAQIPGQLGRVVEVHPVHRADECGGEQDRRPGGDLLELVILIVRHLGEGVDISVRLFVSNVRLTWLTTSTTPSTCP
jgi:hypothetical protein